MRILIIRHGDPYYPTDSLTEKGKREAALLGKRLAKEPIDEIYLSPLGRAQMTAAPTMEAKQMKGEVLEFLREFPAPLTVPYATKNEEAGTCPWNMPPEEWTGQENIYDPQLWRGAQIYQGTQIVETYDRICRAFDQFMEEKGYVKDGGIYRIKPGYEDDRRTFAFFCHLGLGNALISHLMGVSLPVVWHSLFLPTTSVTTVFMEKHRNTPVARARLVGVGDTSHLYAAGEPVSCSGLYTQELR